MVRRIQTIDRPTTEKLSLNGFLILEAVKNLDRSDIPMAASIATQKSIQSYVKKCNFEVGNDEVIQQLNALETGNYLAKVKAYKISGVAPKTYHLTEKGLNAINAERSNPSLIDNTVFLRLPRPAGAGQHLQLKT